MQKVSENYKLSMRKSMRNQSYVKIDFSIIDKAAKNNVTLSTNSSVPYSDLDNINSGSEITNTYITMEKGRYKIGKGQIIYNNEKLLTQGYVSSEISNENGTFTNNPKIEIKSAIPLNTIGFTFEFDHICNEYPREIHLLASLQEENVLDKHFIIDNHFFPLEHHIDAWDKLEIVFEKVAPFHRARIENIMFGITKTFTNKDIISATMIRQCSPISNEIAQNSFDFEIDNFNQAYNPDNPNAIYQYVEEEQEINVEYGYKIDNEIEWVNGGKYVLTGAPTIKENSVTFKSVDTLGNLSDIYYKGMYYANGISMYDLAKNVLEDSGLNENEYVLDDYMKNVFTKAPLPIVTHKECLQIIANASQCLLFVNREGKIQFDVAIDPTITIKDNGGTEYSNSANAYNIPETIQNTIITMEKDFWKVGSNMIIYNENEKQGFTSKHIANDKGLFDVNPTITIDYSIGIPMYEIPIIFGGNVFDFNVKYYLNDNLIESLSITDNQELEYTILKNVLEVTRIELEILKVKPYQRARVNAIGKGRANDFYVDFSSSLSIPVVKKQQPLYAVDVNCYSFTDGDTKELYKEDINVNGEITIKVSFETSKDLNISVSDGFTFRDFCYSQYAIIIIKGNGTCTLNISGTQLNKSSVIVSNIVGLQGETKTLQNPLITDTKNAQMTAKWLSEWLTKRNEYDIEYRGNPEIDAYDIIYAQSKFEKYFPVRVIKNQITFNGALKGSMNVRRT